MWSAAVTVGGEFCFLKTDCLGFEVVDELTSDYATGPITWSLALL